MGILTMTGIKATAYTCKVDGIYYDLDKTAKTASVTEGDSPYVGDIKIPKSIIYKGITYSVTTIGRSAFGYDTNLTTITIPNSVTMIEECAFRVSGLTSIVIPNSVTYLGVGAFSDCI